MRSVAITIVLGIAAALAALPARPAGAQEPDAGQQLRAQLAAAYLRFDRLYTQHPPVSDAARLALNRDFDALTRFFFAGDAGRAVEELAMLTSRLLTTAGPRDLARVTAALTARAEPPVLDRCLGRPGLVRVAPPHGAFALPEPAEARLLLRDADGRIVLTAALRIEPGAPDAAVAVDPADLPAESRSYDMYLQIEDMPPILVGHLPVHCGSMTALRDQNLRRLAELPADPALEQAIASARARNNLLSDTPSPVNSTTVAVDLAGVAAALPGEIDAIARGRNPYSNLVGDTWRVLRLGASDVPLRVYVPLSAGRGEPMPLVIALHGAGGDENLFPGGYGAGLIRRLADEHGFIVASPRTEFFLANPRAFAGLIELMRADYAIDPDRVYAVGHSLGAIASASSAPDLVGSVAAIACLAGPFFTPPGRVGPHALVVAAEHDRIAPPLRLSRLADAARESGMQVEFRALPDLGHTLMVNDALPGAVEWLLRQRLGEPLNRAQ